MVYYISPIVLLISVCLAAFVIDRLGFNGDTRAWSHQYGGFFLPIFLVLMPVDILFRFLTRNHTGYIWLIEMALIICLVLLF